MDKKNNIIIAKFVNWLRFARFARQFFLLFFDIGLVALAYYLAFWLRLDAFASILAPWDIYFSLYWKSVLVLITIRLVFNWIGRQYAWSFSHAGLQEAGRMVFSIFAATLVFICLNYLFNPFGTMPPRSVYVLEASLSLLFLGAIRFAPKYLYALYCRKYSQIKISRRAVPTLIYGAGGNAELLVRELLRTVGHHYQLIGFIDDSAYKKNTFVCGLKVLGNVDDLPKIIDHYKIKEILIAIPGFSGAPLRHLVETCAPYGIVYKIVPRYQRFLDPRANVSTLLENISPEALIHRTLVPFDNRLLAEFYCGMTALVTGAAGSIGSEICSQLASFGINRLVLFDINENALFFLHSDLQRLHPQLKLDLEVGSVQDQCLVKQVLAKYHPDIVIHAAAHKHVPLMEMCPLEAIKNNVLGTFNVARASAAAGVKNFLLISTDKAAAPANIMGATKRMAELVLRHVNTERMQLTIVRFGNVLGSNGSLLQIIQRQIKHGGPVTVTDPKMTRFFMTIPEAIGLVLVTPTLSGHDTFVLEMGEPVNIDALVRHVIALAGLSPGRDIELVYTQKRPGEKLSEVLINNDEAMINTNHPGIMAVRHPQGCQLEIESLLEAINGLEEACEYVQFVAFLRLYLPEFKPADSEETDKFQLTQH